MIRHHERLATGVAAVLALGIICSCTPRVIPDPGAPSAQPPAPAPATAPPPVAPLAGAWQDWPVTDGRWQYRRGTGGTDARFGAAESGAALTLGCDMASRRLTLTVPGGAAARGSVMMTIRTSYGVLQWPAVQDAGAQGATIAVRAASDQGFDWILYSRGRFTVELPGRAPLVLPSWAEPARVVEDCRG